MKSIEEEFKRAMRKSAPLFLFLLLIFFMTAAIVQRAQAAPGDLDPAFGTGGKVMTDFASGYGFSYSMAIQADGKIVVAGGISSTATGTSYDFAVARYNADGSLDTSFGADGKVMNDFASGSSDFARAIAIQIDNKIVAAGVTNFATTTGDFALVRYNADGSLDTSFGSDGKVTTDFGSGDSAEAIAIQADGKIVVVGVTNHSYTNNTGDFALARYNADGSLDTSFGTGGKVTTDFASSIDYAYDVAIQADGKIVAAGCAYSSGNGDFALARYDADGSLDTSFGTGGKLTTDFASNYDGANSIAIQADGKIVVAGVTSADFALARYNADGSLDTSFGTDGKVTTNFWGEDYVLSTAIQADGKILAGGASGEDFALARYNPDGSLDTSFNADGKVTTDFGGEDYGAYSTVIQADGKIVVAGITSADFGLARYLADSPSQQIAGIKVFFDTSVDSTALTGVGSTVTSADGKLNALGSMLDTAESLIQSGSIAEACVQLADAFNKTDSNPNPPDFVAGPAAAQLASQIQGLITSLGCH